MSTIMLGLISYLAGDLITLILSRIGMVNLAPVIKPIVRELLSLAIDPKSGKVSAIERVGKKTVSRQVSDEELKMIQSITQGTR